MKGYMILGLLIGIVLISGCVTQPSETVQLNLTINEWHWGAHDITSSIIEVEEGEEFGPADILLPVEGKPFKLLEIIDGNSIKISYKGLVIAGESLAEATSEQKMQVISLEETCFRTPTLDSGMDICLEIIK